MYFRSADFEVPGQSPFCCPFINIYETFTKRLRSELRISLDKAIATVDICTNTQCSQSAISNSVQAVLNSQVNT